MEIARMLTTFSLLISFCLSGVVAENIQSKTYRSRALDLAPGDVSETIYRMEFPSGHIGLRNFFAEVVDEWGNSVPLSEVYLHHWLAGKIHVKESSVESGLMAPDWTVVPNSGVCESTLVQFYGLGSETRHTNYSIPAPYAIVAGDPDDIPEGYEEAWFLNIHAIDTRGAVNRKGCTECLCELYNLTISRTGKRVPDQYAGGVGCCYHGTHCAVKEGFDGGRRKLYLQYKVEWVPMDSSVLPVRVYIMDVTDNRTSIDQKPHCVVEYDVKQCDTAINDVCVQENHAIAALPESKDVDLLFVNGHLHTGGNAIALYGEDGREFCKSEAIYGTGQEAGNETGYVVGMSTCRPEPGSMIIKAGEELHFKAWYNSEESHTGVMGLVYIYVADRTKFQVEDRNLMLLAVVALAMVAALVIFGVSLSSYVKSKQSSMGYQSLDQA